MQQATTGRLDYDEDDPLNESFLIVFCLFGSKFNYHAETDAFGVVSLFFFSPRSSIRAH